MAGAEPPGLMGNVVFVYKVYRPATSHSDKENHDVEDVCVELIKQVFTKQMMPGGNSDDITSFPSLGRRRA